MPSEVAYWNDVLEVDKIKIQRIADHSLQERKSPDEKKFSGVAKRESRPYRSRVMAHAFDRIKVRGSEKISFVHFQPCHLSFCSLTKKYSR